MFVLFFVFALIFIQNGFSQDIQPCDPFAPIPCPGFFYIQPCDPFAPIPCPGFFCPVGFPNCNPDYVCDCMV
uniref:Uncharacterized protein n=1 Tax=Panagrolaimus sp. PS1159 TaxID=55785 RepID=A0AC35GUA0_9BILA